MPSIDPSVRTASPRAFALFVCGSLALHAALLLALPGWIRPVVTVEALEVTLQRLEPPRVIASAPAAAPPSPPPRVRPPERKTKAAAPEKKAARPPRESPRVIAAPDPPPVLALPAPTATEPTPVAAPPSVPAPAAPEPRATAAPGAAGGPSAGPSRDAGRVAKGGDAFEQNTPPVFNAAYLRNPPPRYPVSARRRGEQGTVLLKVLVTREGAAASIDLEKSSGSAALDQAALDAVKSWRFVPARRGGQPVEAHVLVPIVFRLEGVS